MTNLLHETHPGIVRMKSLARSYVWWPGIDKDLENCSKGCPACRRHQNVEQKTPLHPLQFPKRPWQRLHVDFAGPFQGYVWLITVDAYSKWPEVIPMKVTTATRTIEELRTIFVRWGLSEQIVTDNGPQFISEEFHKFVYSNGIKHSKTTPYHPQSNGAAERFVQTFKQAI